MSKCDHQRVALQGLDFASLQADMGILLTFMFVWNMVGALVLIPALSHFLLHDRHFKNESTTATVAAAVPA